MVLGSRKQKTALSGESCVSDIQMGVWEQPAPAAGAAAGRGGGAARRASGVVGGFRIRLAQEERKKKVNWGLWALLSQDVPACGSTAHQPV